jgi:hypothetical protein
MEKRDKIRILILYLPQTEGEGKGVMSRSPWLYALIFKNVNLFY